MYIFQIYEPLNTPLPVLEFQLFFLLFSGNSHRMSNPRKGARAKVIERGSVTEKGNFCIDKVNAVKYNMYIYHSDHSDLVITW